ncbi:MAG TPA: PilZ domain-containing protein [Polyangia bacterium]|nr:PilZ domain-containing protein [Polyangia bacterium]
MRAAATNADRRRHPRFPLGLPVRLQAEGSREATTIELADVSVRGCRLSAFLESAAPANATRVALGFVLPGQRIALAKGRIVRQHRDASGQGVGLAIEQANGAFYEFVQALSDADARIGRLPA